MVWYFIVTKYCSERILIIQSAFCNVVGGQIVITTSFLDTVFTRMHL